MAKKKNPEMKLLATIGGFDVWEVNGAAMNSLKGNMIGDRSYNSAHKAATKVEWMMRNEP